MRLNVPAFVAILGFSLLILGFGCSNLIFPKLEKFLIEKATALEEGSKGYESWKKIPFPFKLKVYFFNVSNSDQVQEGAKPVLKEMGPYIYDEYRVREVLEINEENDTIKYIQRKQYFFNVDESGCRSEDDLVTILHFAVVSMAKKIYKLSPSLMYVLNDALPYLYPNIKDAFITDTVKNILFDGLLLSCESEEVDMICDSLRSKSPHTMRPADNNRDFLLSLFHHINGSKDGPYEITRGKKNTIKGQIVSIDENPTFSQWATPKCNSIQGTDLTVNPSLWEKPKKINFVASDFCRYFSVNLDKEITYFGLQAYQFSSANLFAMKQNCFCGITAKDSDVKTECPPMGTMDLTPCTSSPIIISQPHFLSAEKSLLDFALGLTPSIDKHGTFIVMEPKTGLALKVKTRFQMNIVLKSYLDIDVLRNVSEGLFPFVWIENGAEIPLDLIDELKSNFSKMKIFDILKYLMMTTGVILLGIALVLAMIKDKIICFYGRKNVVSVKTNEPIGRIMDVYTNMHINKDLVAQNYQN